MGVQRLRAKLLFLPEQLLASVAKKLENRRVRFVEAQVAIAIADLHLLQQKRTSNEAKVTEWMRKAELAVTKQQDDLTAVLLKRRVRV